jgi:hypothetical protein
VIPEIDIWRAAQLMLKRYGEHALEESAARADELLLTGDYDRAATWRQIMAAVAELANTTAPGASALIDDIRPALTTAFDGREVSGPLVTPSSPRGRQMMLASSRPPP